MATGENLFSMQDARNLIRYGGMRPDRDWLQFDCALSYGLVEYLRTLDMLKQYGWSPRAVCRTAATRCRSRLRPASGSAATSRTRISFSLMAGSPTGSKSSTATSCCPSFLASASREKVICIERCVLSRTENKGLDRHYDTCVRSRVQAGPALLRRAVPSAASPSLAKNPFVPMRCRAD